MYAVQCLLNRDINSETYMKTGGRHRKQKAETGTGTKKQTCCGAVKLETGRRTVVGKIETATHGHYEQTDIHTEILYVIE
jgi:hypothetical protein